MERMKLTNVERAETAQHILERYHLDTPEKRKLDLLNEFETVERFLTDLRHYCYLRGINFTRALAGSLKAHREEEETPALVAQHDVLIED